MDCRIDAYRLDRKEHGGRWHRGLQALEILGVDADRYRPRDGGQIYASMKRMGIAIGTNSNVNYILYQSTMINAKYYKSVVDLTRFQSKFATRFRTSDR
jgi:hypothetical protein